jgi:Ca2+-binding EF-hand superfamily protein
VAVIAFSGLVRSESLAVHELFKSIDRNRDSKVDRQEFSEDVKKHAFEKLDKDSNASITYEEWDNSLYITDEEKHTRLFQRFDKDRDRIITFLEFSDYATRDSNLEEVFIGLDRDRNNFLTPDELTMRPHIRFITIRF